MVDRNELKSLVSRRNTQSFRSTHFVALIFFFLVFPRSQLCVAIVHTHKTNKTRKLSNDSLHEFVMKQKANKILCRTQLPFLLFTNRKFMFQFLTTQIEWKFNEIYNFTV